MLRQFSIQRIVGAFFFDWFGSLAALLVAARARPVLGSLPPALTRLLESLSIASGGGIGGSQLSNLLPLPPGALLMVACIWPVFLGAMAVYDGRRSGRLRDELRNLFLGVCGATLALSGALFLSFRETSRLLILVFLIVDLVLLLGARIGFYLLRRGQNGSRRAAGRNVLVVGAGPIGRHAVSQLAQYAAEDIHLVGFVDSAPEIQGQTVAGLPVLGSLERLSELVHEHRCWNAVVALPMEEHEQLVKTCKTLQLVGVRVHVIPDLFTLSFPGAALDGFGGIPVIDLGQPGLGGYRRAGKRVVDMAISAGLLLLFSPVLLLVAIAIKLESPGPVIYKQQRIGEFGHPFTLLKFRSMRDGAGTDVHKTHMARLIKENLSVEQTGDAAHGSLKLEQDRRITRVGKLIRRTSIDELPQLINVMRGEMSLVGPRPPLPYEVEIYSPWHLRRLDFLPGLTGWWQVKGRNRVSFDEMVRMDLYYIEHASPMLDLQILLRTPWAMLSARGAG